MPKSQYIDPTQMRKPGEITFTPIPVNQYNKTVKDELKAKHFTKDDLKRIYRDMVVIREFETMLQLVKTTGGYNGVEYHNPGPAHLSAGQEAAAVGMAYMLDINDFIFGSHRSHGEILAKGLRAIELLDDKSLEKIMNEFWDGATVNVAKKAFKGGTTKAGYPLPALRGAGRGIRPHDRIQQGSGRQYAHVLHAVRHLSEQRDRGRQRQHRRGRGPL